MAIALGVNCIYSVCPAPERVGVEYITLMQLNIRPAVDTDFPYIVRAWRRYLLDIADEATFIEVARKVTMAELTAEPYAAWVAEGDQKLVGFIFARSLQSHPLTARYDAPQALYISMLWVEPGARQENAGAALYAPLEALAQTMGAHIVCDTHDFLGAFLERHGFVTVNTFVKLAGRQARNS